MLAHMNLQGLKGELITPTTEPETLVIGKEESAENFAQRLKAEQFKKEERAENAMDILTLHLGDHVLRKTEECTTARDLWVALERLYNTKTRPSRIHLLYKFYTFKMDGSKSIDQNIDDFLKTVSELASEKVTVTDEVQAILLLSSLPPHYDSMKETLKYGRESISIEDVVNAAKSKETELKAKGISTSQNSGEAYVARGRQQNKDQRNSGNRGRSKSKSGTKVTCWFYKKNGHVKVDCYAWKKRKGGDDEDAMAAVVIEQSAGVDALSVSKN
ncbi:Retrovirus-related Pol polyprotein from transposon TNT 1-94 [Cardamine amara subsp. amara]|uniref:Retrovirus-related Pol polyprotein from transposon TNT 1-94 n=1 Tax=Cardamine amara subsp. amara TaxID=228776 RepID=A0ABD0ZTR0_CARAN